MLLLFEKKRFWRSRRTRRERERERSYRCSVWGWENLNHDENWVEILTNTNKWDLQIERGYVPFKSFGSVSFFWKLLIWVDVSRLENSKLQIRIFFDSMWFFGTAKLSERFLSEDENKKKSKSYIYIVTKKE